MAKTIKTNKEKDLKISELKTKSNDNDKGSRSKITQHEGTSLQQRQRPRPQELNNKSNLINLMKECHSEITLGEIVSLKNIESNMKRYPEKFLCVVGLSCYFDDVFVRPTLLEDDGSDVGLFDVVKSSDPFKVKTGERTLAEGEIPLNDETVNMTEPPSAEIVQIVDHTIVDEVKELTGKKKRRVIFWELPAKRLRADATVASEAFLPWWLDSAWGWLFGPSSFYRVVLSSSYGPDDEATPLGVEDVAAASTGWVGALGNNVEAFTSVPDAASPTGDFYDSQTVKTATVDNIYVQEWGVTNGARVDNPALCRNLLDHITPPGYWAMLHNRSPVDFLDGFNINSVQHTCMIFELRLRHEHKIMTREKFQKKFTDNCAVVQQRDAENAALRTRLEKAEREAAEVVSLRGRVSELETVVAVKYVIKLGGDCEHLRKEAVGEAKLREEFKSFQDTEACRFEQKSAELDARITDVKRDMNNDLYPHMFTAIAGRRWVLSHDVRLTVEAYDPGVKDDFVSAVTDFENVSFGLLDELESLKDSLLTSIMPALVLKVAQGNVVSTPEVISTTRAPAERRGLCLRPVGGISGSTPPHGSSLGIAVYQVSTLVLSSDGGPTTQPPVTHAHDDLFDTSVLDGTDGI
ncbi:hypothetical protein Tco_0348178 [Tanacetum coccineum]